MNASPVLCVVTRHASLATLVVVLGACSWFTDFKEQPGIKPWESVADTIAPRGQPVNSVPVTGLTTPGYTYSYAALPSVIDSFSVIPNPKDPAKLSPAELSGLTEEQAALLLARLYSERGSEGAS